MNEYRVGSETGGRGALPEKDGRCFMALLDMIHFLVDRITSSQRFNNVEEAAMLRTTNTQACAILTAEAYTYWYSGHQGHELASSGVFEMLCDWTAKSKENDPGSLGFGANGTTSFNDAIHAFAINECSQWPRRRKSGKFYYAGDDESGTALLADDKLEKVYRVVGISKSVGDMLRACPSGVAEVGSMVRITLLPWLGQIIYDGTLMGGPPLSLTDPSRMDHLQSLVESAKTEGLVICELPTVTDAPLLGKRVVVSGIRAKPELNGRIGIAGTFDDAAGRYVVSLEDGGGSFKVKPDNLAITPPRLDIDGVGSAMRLSQRDVNLQQRIQALPRRDDDMWVFRRTGYTEEENPNHGGVIMSGKSGMILGTFQSAHLAPTPAEYLGALKVTLFGGRGSLTGGSGVGFKPLILSFDEQSALKKLKAVLEPAGVQVLYYPPPSDEELTAMGVATHRDGFPPLMGRRS